VRTGDSKNNRTSVFCMRLQDAGEEASKLVLTNPLPTLRASESCSAESTESKRPRFSPAPPCPANLAGRVGWQGLGSKQGGRNSKHTTPRIRTFSPSQQARPSTPSGELQRRIDVPRGVTDTAQTWVPLPRSPSDVYKRTVLAAGSQHERPVETSASAPGSTRPSAAGFPTIRGQK